MSRLRAPRAGRPVAVIAFVFAAFLALVAVDGAGDATAADGSSDSSARVAGGRPGGGELLVPTRPSAAAGRVDPGVATTRPFLEAAVVSAVATLLVALVAGLVRRRPGLPWHHRRRHSAVLRAPPLLLHP